MHVCAGYEDLTIQPLAACISWDLAVLPMICKLTEHQLAIDARPQKQP